MGKYGNQIALRATFDTKQAEAGMRAFAGVVARNAREEKTLYTRLSLDQVRAATTAHGQIKSITQESMRGKLAVWKREETEHSAHLRRMGADAAAAARKQQQMMLQPATGQPRSPSRGAGFAAGTLGPGSFIAPIAVAATAKAAFDYLDTATKKAGDLGEAVNLTQTIFKGASASVEDWAKKNASAFGQTETQALTAAGLYGNMLNNAGAANDESARLAKELTERATDLASLFNTDIQTALDAIQSGLQGESTPLRQFGVFLSEADIAASKFAQSLGKVPPSAEKVKQAQDAVRVATFKADEAQRKYGANAVQTIQAVSRREKAEQALAKAHGNTTRELTLGEKVLARTQFILEKSSVAAGDFAKTSDSAANKQRTLTAEMDKLQTKIGQDLLPLKVQFLAFFEDAIPVAEDLAQGFKDAGGAISEFVKEIEEADSQDFGAGPGLKRLLDNLRALKEILSLNWARMIHEKTETGKTIQTKQDLSLFKDRRAKLDEFYKLRQTDPDSPRVEQLNRSIFDENLYGRARAYGVDTVRRGLPGEDYAILDHAIKEASKRDAAAMAKSKQERGKEAAAAKAAAVPPPPPKPDPKPTPPPPVFQPAAAGGARI